MAAATAAAASPPPPPPPRCVRVRVGAGSLGVLLDDSVDGAGEYAAAGAVVNGFGGSCRPEVRSEVPMHSRIVRVWVHAAEAEDDHAPPSAIDTSRMTLLEIIQVGVCYIVVRVSFTAGDRPVVEHSVLLDVPCRCGRSAAQALRAPRALRACMP
jgi:hypothetical protein